MLLQALLITLPVLAIASLARTYIHNLRAARKSGLPYINVPVFVMSNWWFTLQPFLLPLIKLLPGSNNWVPLTVFFDVWHHSRRPFAQIGADTFMTVAPEGNALWTSDASVVMQLGRSCPSARLMVSPLNLYGPCIAGTKGEETRRYRKVMAPFWSEATHERIWRYGIEEGGEMVARWKRPGTVVRRAEALQKDALALMVHIASLTFFSRRCRWEASGMEGKEKTGDHVMKFDTALLAMMRLIWVIALTPRLLLALPLSICKRARVAYHEWGRYMHEMRESRALELSQGITSHHDLLDTLVRACPDLTEPTEAQDTDGNISDAGRMNKGITITPEAVSGNMFLAILAGHETSAHTLAIVLLVLACRPETQQILHHELDKVLGTRSTEQWSYREDCSTLLQGFTGAIVYETLRLWPMAPATLKSTEEEERTISINGRTHVIGKKTLVVLHTAGAQTHPSYWENTPPKEAIPGECYPYPLSSFDPARWLTSRKIMPDSSDEETWMDQMRPESERRQRLRLAEPGTFFPFSEGASACLGSRMALVEVTAAIAIICKHFTVRLPVEEGKTWDKARSEAAKKLTAGMRFRVALHVGTPIALDFIPR